MNPSLIRSLAVKVNNGSGCLFSTSAEYVYVLTARHCIVDFKNNADIQSFNKDLNQVNVWIGTAKDQSQRLEVLDYFISEDIEIDIAVIIVKLNAKPASIYYKKPYYKQAAIAFGYPDMRKNESDPREFLECHVGMDSEDETNFDLTASHGLNSFEKTAYDNVVGLSGSGVFESCGESLQLLGILARLKNRDGSYNRLKAYNIDSFNKILENKEFAGGTLKPLIPEFLSSFEHYISALFPFTNDGLAKILGEQAMVVHNTGLTPKHIVEFLNEKVFIPHSKGISINNPELWQGWLEFLTYLSFDEDNANLDNLPKSLLRPESSLSKNYFYYLVEGNSWGQAVRFLLIKSEKKFKPGSKFFINNGPRPLVPHALPESELAKIIMRIDGDDITSLTNKIKIDRPSLATQYSFVHLQKFSTIFSDPSFADISDAEELKKKIHLELKELLFND